MSTPTYNRKRSYTSPKRIASLDAHFQSRVNIGRRTETQDEFNEIVIEYIVDHTLTDIPAYVEPAFAGAGEMRQPEQTIVVNKFQIYLKGYYPTILVSDRAYVDSVPHDILNVAHDDSNTLTVLTSEIVNPASNEAIPD